MVPAPLAAHDVSESVPHVVCLGGGYVALYLRRALRGSLRRGRVRLTIIDRNNYHCFHGLVPETLGGTLQPGNILSPSRRLFGSRHFRRAEIESIDLDAREVTVSRTLDGKQFVVRYDHLVFAMGSKDDLDRFPGAAEHTRRLKLYPDILAARHHLISMLELAAIETDPVEQRRLLTFVVAGGNYAGVEVASELADFLPRVLRRSYADLPEDELRVVLLHAGDRILPELGEHFPRLRDYAESVLPDPHLEIRTGSRLASATSSEAILDDGTRIQTRTIINCTGTRIDPLIAALPFEKDPSGRLVTTPFTNLPGAEHIWAAGDCAAVPHPRGGTCPPLAIWAMTAGRTIGQNIVRSLQGRPLRPYRFTGLGDACTLGKRRAAAHLKGIEMRGLVAYLAWRFFMLVYLPAPEKKVRTALDWGLASVFGRDLVDMNVQRPLTIEAAHFAPGQDVVRQGDIGTGLYIVKSGSLDVFIIEPDGERFVRTLTAGDHFGEKAVFENVRRTATVRARTAVELLQVRREAALALARNLASARGAFDRTWE